MNLIGSRPDGWWRDRRAAMRRLAARLDRFAETTGGHVTVVFDGAPFELDGPEGERAGAEGLEVLFASRRGRDAADDRIAELVGGDRDPGSLRVVTSDRDLAERVRAGGAEAVSTRAFARRLEASGEPRG